MLLPERIFVNIIETVKDKFRGLCGIDRARSSASTSWWRSRSQNEFSVVVAPRRGIALSATPGEIMHGGLLARGLVRYTVTVSLRKPPLPGTLAAFATEGHSAYVVCPHCGHFSFHALYDIATQVGWRAQLADISRRMKCRICGHRGATLTHERPRTGERVCPRCQRPLYQRLR